MALNPHRWGYVRIIAGTIAGGIFGFYVMHKVEVSYKEKMKERLRQYENELKKKEQLNELEDSSMIHHLEKVLVSFTGRVYSGWWLSSGFQIGAELPTIIQYEVDNAGEDLLGLVKEGKDGYRIRLF